MAVRVSPGPVDASAEVREAVCVHTRKIYDSCRDKDCVEDLRLYPDAASYQYIAGAMGVRAKSAELLYAGVEVEEVAFNRGYFTVDIRYYYKIKAETYSFSDGTADITGLAVFDKRVLLFGSESSARIFSSRGCGGTDGSMLPVAVVDAAATGKARRDRPGAAVPQPASPALFAGERIFG